MCGIFGLISKTGDFKDNGEAELLQKSIAHRGPDGHGVHRFRNGFAGNVRLAIVDRASGHQPIYSKNQKSGIVYNGEVYNHNELRGHLQDKGRIFSTKSDTEVVLENFNQYGTDGINNLNGMFAFCHWDDDKNEVHIVRDQIGIKPLYIYEDGQKLVFSSELKSLMAFPGLDLSLNPLGFQDYFIYRYVLGPFTFFKNIRKLEPGFLLKIKDGQVTQWRYWDTQYDEKYPFASVEEAKEKLDDLFTKAVKSQLMGEVPVGVLLSGGVDSSAIAHYVHKAGANLKTFNIGFPEVNEFKYSRQVAQKFGLDSIEIETSVDELIELYDKVNWALDEPIADPACLPLYRLCIELKKHVTVVLSGEGGDELFAGYNQYREVATTDMAWQDQYNHFIKRSWYFDDFKKFLINKHLPPSYLRFRKYFEENSLLNGMLNFDMKTWMPDNLMMKADKILMAHSLEGRFPFLDRDLYHYSSQLPEKYKLNGKTTKWLLKELITPVMPPDVIHRPKMGFTVPVDILNQKMKDRVFSSLDSADKSELSTVLDIPEIRKVTEDYYKNNRSENTLKIWTYFTLLYWFTKNRSL